MRYLALDVGDRRIGLAVGDDAFGITRALPTLRRSRRLAADIERIADLARGEEVGALVVGLPLTLRGEDGPQAERARRFASALAGIGLQGRALTLQPLLLNTRRRLFAHAAMRRAANFAVDRRALARHAGVGFSGVPRRSVPAAGIDRLH